MDYFDDLISPREERERLPDWVSKNNKSYEAYVAMHELKAERMEYILTHRNRSDYKAKFRSYQISGSQVALKVSISKVTLISTSAYSGGFKDALTEINRELMDAKKIKLGGAGKNRNGSATKAESTVDSVAVLQRKIKEAEMTNAQEQVAVALDHLSETIKEALLISRSEKNILQMAIQVGRNS